MVGGNWVCKRAFRTNIFWGYKWWGVTFVGELYTGRVIDFEFTEKCFECDDCDDFATNGTCQNGGKFHGDAGAMETHNAIILLKRSQQYGFRYTTIIADGDAKVYNNLSKLNKQGLLYPGVTIEKFECANHTQKRAMKSLVTYGVKYEGEAPIPSGQAKPPTDPTTPSVADFFPRVPKPT